MRYSIYKDDKIKNTIEKLKNIISNLGIELTEEIYNNNCSSPISVRLTIKNTNIGVNGKGTSKENALASAYAEFIERLQNWYLCNLNDEFIQILKDNKNTLKANIDFLDFNFDYKEKLYNSLKKKWKLKNLVYIPYVNIENKKLYTLPYNIILHSKGSNGMAAGNTLEEALVQGLSEVCERYVIKEIFKKKISLPIIPEKEYIKYSNIKKIIQTLQKIGYKIYIKDASLNGQLPVICTIIENTDKNTFHFSFGAQPSLAIAIERTLTEFAQGISLSEYKNNPFIYPFYSKEKLKHTNTEKLLQSIIHLKIGIEKNSLIENQFFIKEPNYKYKKSCWINSDKKLTNKDLLLFLIKRIEKISTNIFVRDTSFLGFSTVDIYIPKFSEIFKFDRKTVETFLLDRQWGDFSKKNKQNVEIYNINNLMKLAEEYTFFEKSPCYCKDIFSVPFEYIAFLCSIVLKKNNKIIKYAQIILGQNRFLNIYETEQIELIKIIRDYAKNIKDSKTKILNKLKKKYKINDIEEAIQIYEKLTFNDILEVVIYNKKMKKEKIPKVIVKKLRKEYIKKTQDKKMLNFLINEI